MWDEGGSGGKRIHPSRNNGVNKGLNKRIDEEKDWGAAKTKPGTQIRSEGIPTIGWVYQKGKRATKGNQLATSR
jgi:hypothetical protein